MCLWAREIQVEIQTGGQKAKKVNLSYAALCATLVKLQIDLSWADDKYLFMLMDIMGEYMKQVKPPERKKVGSANIGKFIKE